MPAVLGVLARPERCAGAVLRGVLLADWEAGVVAGAGAGAGAGGVRAVLVAGYLRAGGAVGSG